MIALLQLGKAGEAAPLVERMAELVPDRVQVVDQLRRIVALVDFDWPADRGDARVGAVRPPAAADVELVTFHVALEAGAGFDYAALLAHSFESARLRAPASRRVLLTDEHTKLPSFGAGVDVMRVPLDREHLMYERMRVQHEYLLARRPGTATVFLDSDVVVNAEPAPVFGEDFDVGLTYRPVVDAPFNGGVIFVAPGEGGERSFAKALACYRALAEAPAIAPRFPRDLRAWWGDQYALAALVGWRALGTRGSDTVSVDGVRVRIFPCETHNHTVEAREYGAHELRSKFFIHFKGARKELMARYLETLRKA